MRTLSSSSLFICLLVLFLFGCKQKKQQESLDLPLNDQPNILLIYTDDQSFMALQALGNSEIHTPTMDQLVAEGTTFTHAYNMGGWNGAICLASRAMMISGRHIWRAQEFSERLSENRETEKTWPKLMENQGYETYMTGKWHISIPPDSLFNHVKSVLPGMPKDSPEGYNRPLSKNDTLWQPWKKEYGGYWEGGQHWSELVRDDALSFISQASRSPNPFFMYVAFNAPHDPRQTPKSYVDAYQLDSIALPKSFVPEYPYAEAMGSGRELRDEMLAPFPRTEYAVKVNRQEYYALVTHLDEQIKQILEALETYNLRENTYIFFTSDHGLAIGEHGLLGKQSMFDHSVRVPFVMIGPNIPKNKKINNDIYLQDIVATSLELAGAKKPAYIEFNSVLDLALGKTKKGYYDAIYGCYEQASQRMIRKDQFKLIVYPKISKVLLFDLEKDPLELEDLSLDPLNAPLIKNMFLDLMELQQEMGDQLDLYPIFEILFKEDNTA